jgi:hypothetical protein
MEEFDTIFTAEIVCPHCGKENGDSWELRRDSGKTTCGWCDEEMQYERNVEVTYSTSKIPDRTPTRQEGEHEQG